MYIYCSIRDESIITNPLVVMATQLSEDKEEKIVSLLINITVYYM